MKKIFSILFTLVVAMAFTMSLQSCKKDPAKIADENIRKSVSTLVFPQDLKETGKLVGLDYTDKVLTFRIEIDQDKLRSMNVDTVRSQTLRSLKTGLFRRNLIDNVNKAGASVKYIYINDSDSVSFSFTPEELK